MLAAAAAAAAGFYTSSTTHQSGRRRRTPCRRPPPPWRPRAGLGTRPSWPGAPRRRRRRSRQTLRQAAARAAAARRQSTAGGRRALRPGSGCCAGRARRQTGAGAARSAAWWVVVLLLLRCCPRRRPAGRCNARRVRCCCCCCSVTCRGHRKALTQRALEQAWSTQPTAACSRALRLRASAAPAIIQSVVQLSSQQILGLATAGQAKPWLSQREAARPQQAARSTPGCAPRSHLPVVPRPRAAACSRCACSSRASPGMAGLLACSDALPVAGMAAQAAPAAPGGAVLHSAGAGRARSCLRWAPQQQGLLHVLLSHCGR